MSDEPDERPAKKYVSIKAALPDLAEVVDE